MSKVWAIHGGGDWADASADYLVLPDGMDIESEKKVWDDWYRYEYCASLHGKRIKYRSFLEHLISKGARRPADEELEIFWER